LKPTHVWNKKLNSVQLGGNKILCKRQLHGYCVIILKNKLRPFYGVDYEVKLQAGWRFLSV
jgi:hypothetical protein